MIPHPHNGFVMQGGAREWRVLPTGSPAYVGRLYACLDWIEARYQRPMLDFNDHLALARICPNIVVGLGESHITPADLATRQRAGRHPLRQAPAMIYITYRGAHWLVIDPVRFTLNGSPTLEFSGDALAIITDLDRARYAPNLWAMPSPAARGALVGA